nr:MAG TPA: hypothetical protein [Crassvirales sp.]
MHITLLLYGASMLTLNLFLLLLLKQHHLNFLP